MATTQFDWIPFYTELAQKLLEYKNRRDELVEFIYAEDGLRDFTNYLHLQDKTQRIDDIDPLSFIGIFNRGKLSTENRKVITLRIKVKLGLKSAIPSEFDGIPVLNYKRMFLFRWNDFHKSCNDIWEAFESFMYGDLKPWFIYRKIEKRKAESTIPLFWCKPNNYISLDSRNCDYLKKYGIDVKVNDVDSYQKLVEEIRRKMASGEIHEKNFPEISFNAWMNDNNPSQNTTNEQSMNEFVNLLRATHNLILTGAPGTGKTYLAKQIAEAMGCTDNEIGFVQFHPSYDYTDFVEGLRPIQDDNSNVGFERKDGIFKKFCAKALSSKTVNTIDNFEEAWVRFVGELNEKQYIDIPFLRDKTKSFRVELYKYRTGLANRTYRNDDFQKGEWIKGQSKFFSKEQLYNIYKGLKGVPSGGHDNYRRAIIEELKNIFGLEPYQEGNTNSDENTEKKFVFIIDEINRGEISKIFGELFFSIDPGYRGEKGRVQTQYQNLVDDGDVFKKGFFVPKNVYIIGTMNDIDRSVESMDFAFRRRFAFKEIKADENVGMLDQLGDLKTKAINRMKHLNAAIEKIEGLSSAYHIGASYFLKLNDYDGDFSKLWEYHIKGLLLEYLRGMTEVDTKIEELHTAYNNESDSDNGQQQ